MRRVEVELPCRELWLEPVCNDCVQAGVEITWCWDKDVYSPCRVCGRKPIHYLIDRRQMPRAK